MFLARVYVTLKPGVNDPQGQTIMGGLHRLGFSSVKAVRAGKYFEVTLDEGSLSAARAQVKALCEKLLANLVIEEFRFTLERLDSKAMKVVPLRRGQF